MVAGLRFSGCASGSGPRIELLAARGDLRKGSGPPPSTPPSQGAKGASSAHPGARGAPRLKAN